MTPSGKYHGMEQTGAVGNPLWDKLSSSPAVSSNGNGDIGVFVRAMDNTLAYKLWNGTNWSSWKTAPSVVLGSAPASLYSGINKIDVFARGLDKALGQISWNGTNWSGWITLGGEVTSAPSAIHYYQENRK